MERECDGGCGGDGESDSDDSDGDGGDNSDGGDASPCEGGELGGCEDEDDQMLTFQEFKQKMSEQGGAQIQQDVKGGANTRNTVLANYASSDCGAKVVESNPEAQV